MSIYYRTESTRNFKEATFFFFEDKQLCLIFIFLLITPCFCYRATMIVKIQFAMKESPLGKPFTFFVILLVSQINQV